MCAGRLIDEVEQARDVRALLAEGALNGLSIGFRTLRAQTRRIFKNKRDEHPHPS